MKSVLTKTDTSALRNGEPTTWRNWELMPAWIARNEPMVKATASNPIRCMMNKGGDVYLAYVRSSSFCSDLEDREWKNVARWLTTFCSTWIKRLQANLPIKIYSFPLCTHFLVGTAKRLWRML